MSESQGAEPAVDVGAEDSAGLTNKSVLKATVLLGELGRHRPGLTATEIAQAVGMTRPTAFRLLLTLEQAGFVDRVDNRYTLGWQIARLGRLADPYSGAVARIQPVLDDYARKLNETLSFAMLRGATEYDIVAEGSSSRFLNASQRYVGGKFPLYASATGKVMLAELDDASVRQVLPERLDPLTAHTITSVDEFLAELAKVREQGYAQLDNELEEGLFSVACGVRDKVGALIGIVSISGPVERLKSDRLPYTVVQLRQAAEEIAEALS
ncbi:IclR family transcriptional regulator [Gordonia rhizosphera]|uniref:Putative IclR family transcriptional regulator n=1 Tax=Gordonia rhizosphera NBRC 16068 TaxID=1108045 RepID=K6V2F0_9ACTN|nr:IclR family transcriptional regulator [Gordonia rhizosphera]GAB90168.1 putative IclR family transcriptional regulator [Gordonia rhizosphera NBRC 16068]